LGSHHRRSPGRRLHLDADERTVHDGPDHDVLDDGTGSNRAGTCTGTDDASSA
jgi:hypothetical protein